MHFIVDGKLSCEKTTILTLCAHKGLSRILWLYFRGHNSGFRAIHATTTSFADLARWKEKPVVTWERLILALACVGTVFAHLLFTHLIRPPEEEERNIQEEDRKKKKGNIRFSPQKCGLKHRDFEGGLVYYGVLGPLHLSRPLRGSFADFSGNSGARKESCNHIRESTCVRSCSKVSQT